MGAVADDVQLTDLEVIAPVSLAANGVTAAAVRPAARIGQA